MTTRHFPPPCTVEETDACLVVKDQAGHSLAYVYFEEEPGRRSAAHLLTRDEARRIVACEFGACEPVFASLSSPVTAAV